MSNGLLFDLEPVLDDKGKQPQRELKEGDRVKRKPKYGSYLNDKVGTIETIDKYHRAYIKWDTAASNHQYHSTINVKNLLLADEDTTTHN